MKSSKEVTCPACFEQFTLWGSPLESSAGEFDYDCEVCCHPMVIRVDEEGDFMALPLDEAY